MNTLYTSDSHRNLQISELQRFCPEVIVRKPGVYALPLMFSSGTLNLIISLPDRFPYEVPVIHVEPAALHAIIGPDTRILPSAHPNLRAWNIHLSLGKTVSDVKQLLLQNPPTILSSQSQPMRSSMVEQPPPYQRPSASAIPEIQSITDEQVQLFLRDEQAFQNFFDQLEAVRAANRMRAEISSANAAAAKMNLSKEQELTELRAELGRKRQEIQVTRAEFDALMVRQQGVMKQYAVDSLISKLSQAANEADHESEQLASQFMSGEVDVATFIPQFIEKRKLYHQRSAKCDSIMLHHKPR